MTVARSDLRSGSQDIAFALRDAKSGETRDAGGVFVSGEQP
ncbi:MAG: hypothetical protein WDM81_08210 [Rhizomicrobium sp.]